ncbi:MAG TPA: type I-D CRISPR-associated protein Cas5/Csc1 [Ktedonobacteraceae bacterium]|nr:type I-D CRISPR-associated protein Cas5/Csc1 [Ktedonobacteraceae bacterium]
MQLYRCDITLHDYLFFATTERGKVAETGPFIHNYALTYALGWASSPWRNDVQKPHYREELAQVGHRYVTPARLVRGSYVVSQYNTMTESYHLGKAQSIGYPDWGFIKCFRPGTIFRFYVLSAGEVQFPHFLRLGKFMAKTVISTAVAQKIEQRAEWTERQERGAHPLLNWNDLPTSARPAIYDIIATALPTRLVDNPVFNGIAGPYLSATFENEDVPVQFPLQMGYFGENLCVSW